MIRRLSRLAFVLCLAFSAVAGGLFQTVEAQTIVGPNFDIQVPTIVPSGGQFTAYIIHWEDYDLQVDEGTETATHYDFSSGTWASSCGTIEDVGIDDLGIPYATIDAPIVSSDMTLTVSASATDGRPQPKTSGLVSASLTVSGTPCITLEINQPGPPDNYLALGGTASLTVGVQGGSGSASYSVALSSAGTGNVTFSSNPVTVTGGGTQAVTITGATSGYFTITGTASGAAPATVNGSVVSLDIVRTVANGTAIITGSTTTVVGSGGTTIGITGATSSVMVGQHLVLSGSVQPAGVLVASSSWTVPGTPGTALVKSYNQSVASAGTAALSVADLSGGSVGYYWVAGASGQIVSYSATIGGVTFNPSTTFNVLCPTSTLNCAMTTNTPAVSCGVDPGFGDGIELSCGTIGAPGLSYSGAVTTPNLGAGAIAFTQLIKTERQRTLWPFGSVQHWTSNGDYILDDPIHSAGPVAIGGDDTKPVGSDDSPGTTLAGKSQASVEDDFHLYLMYKPSGNDSIWVAIGEIHWDWSADCDWYLIYGWTLHSYSTGHPPINLDTPCPTWTKYFNNLSWQ